MPKENLRELIVGAAAAVATPFDENYEVDLGKMYDLTQWWVANGLVKRNGIIKVAAAAGEGPMLDDPEWASLLRTTVQASDGKATVMCGLHYKDTKRTIRGCARSRRTWELTPFRSARPSSTTQAKTTSLTTTATYPTPSTSESWSTTLIG